MLPLRILVFSGYGINCEAETKFAFEKASEFTGIPIVVDILHINAIIRASHVSLLDYRIVVFPGGFSYGDDTGAGRAYAMRVRNNLGSQIDAFLERSDSGVMLGICNGCQILVHLLDEFSDISLHPNICGSYHCLWTEVEAKNIWRDSFWFAGLDYMKIPIAHGEGRFEFSSKERADSTIALAYTEENINGSQFNAAAVCGYGGRVMAMMPHPERALLSVQRDDYFAIRDRAFRDKKALDDFAVGMHFFSNMLRHFV